METISRQFGRSAVRLLVGDITQIPADAIVNAANSALQGGGGVDGAIHRAAGTNLQLELDAVRPPEGCQPGKAVVTSAGHLPAKFVFHAVGPIWRGGKQNEAETLASCYQTCLALADQKIAKIVSFPSISTGAYRYPLEQAAAIAIKTVSHYLASTPNTIIDEVLFVLYDQPTFEAYSTALNAAAPAKT